MVESIVVVRGLSLSNAVVRMMLMWLIQMQVVPLSKLMAWW